MHPGALRALEFDRIVSVVTGLALTPTGGARLSSLRPLTEPGRVLAAQRATTEGVRFLADHPGFPLRAPTDLEAILDALGIEGRALDGLRLIGLADYLESIEQARAAVKKLTGAFPILNSLVETVASFKTEIADVRRKIDPAGVVVDNASAALSGIRDRLRKQRARLRNTLESFLRGRDTAKYLQDQVVTDRNGRYVLIIRAEHRSAIPGTAQHRRDQQRHRRARRAGGRRGPADPARTHRCVPRPAGRAAPHHRRGDRARCHSSEGALCPTGRRRRAGHRPRRHVRAARRPASTADGPGQRMAEGWP